MNSDRRGKDLETLSENLWGWTEAWKDIRIKPEVAGRVTMKLYLGQDHKGQMISWDCVYNGGKEH